MRMPSVLVLLVSAELSACLMTPLRKKQKMKMRALEAAAAKELKATLARRLDSLDSQPAERRSAARPSNNY